VDKLKSIPWYCYS